MDKGRIRRQSGFSTAGIVAVVAILGAGAGGFFAWQQANEASKAQIELAGMKAGFDKARNELRKAQQDLNALTKDLTELKIASDHMRAERDAVRAVLETEQAVGVRLRAETALAKEQVSYLSARSSPSVVRGLPRGPGGK